MKGFLLALVVSSPIAITFGFDTPRPKTIPLPRCSSSTLTHIPTPRPPPHVRTPRVPHPHDSPGSGVPPLHVRGGAFDETTPHIRPVHPHELSRSVDAELHAIASSTDDQAARQAENKFIDADSHLSSSRLSSQISSRHFYRQSFDDYLDEIVDQPRLISAIPTNEQAFLKVYSSRSYTATNRKSLESFNKELNNVDSAQLQKSSSISELEDAISMADSRPIVIFGHSEGKGKILVLASGEKAHVAEIHSYCQRMEKACMVLTCNGDDFSIGGKLIATHALKMWKESTKLAGAKNGSPLTVLQFRDEMIRVRTTLKVAEFVTLSIATTSTAGGTVYVVSSTGDRKKKSWSAPLKTPTSAALVR